METEGDEASHQHPKPSKPTNLTQFPSPSSEDSILANPSLPQEIIEAILVRLPVKYLLQFKCVSKNWFGLISSPHFVNKHLNFSAKDFTRHRLLLKLAKNHSLLHNLKHCSVSSLFYESVTESFDLDYPMKISDQSGRIVGSVNGLICYCFEFIGLVLWNPSTTKFKQVPDLMPRKAKDYRFSYGFGYDEVHDDYKVVEIFRNIPKRYVDAKIYSLKSDSWRTLHDFQTEKLGYSPGKLVNGRLHWVTIRHGGNGIMSFNLVDEKCREVEQPFYGEDTFLLKIAVLGSDISAICGNENTYERTDVWVMKEYGVKESWTKLYTINFQFSRPLYMSLEGEILNQFQSSLTIYNPEDDLVRYPEVTNIDGHPEAELYTESLVSPILQNEPM